MIQQSDVCKSALAFCMSVLTVFGARWVNAVSANPVRDPERGVHYRVDADALIEMTGSWLQGELDGDGDFVAPILMDPNLIDVNVAPTGGYIELESGLVIDIPAGAVEEETSFQIRLLRDEEAQPYLDGGLTTKHFLGGYEVISDGIDFNEPITLRFPVKPRSDSTSLPYFFIRTQDADVLIPDITEELFLPDEEPQIIMALAPDDSAFRFIESGAADGRQAEVDLRLRNVPPGQRWAVLNALEDVLPYNECEVNPCRCLGIKPVSKSADYESANRCSNVSVSGSVTFFECPGQPTEVWAFQEQSIYIAVKFTPDRRSIPCEGSLTLTVDVFGIDKNRLESYDVSVTSAKPEILDVTSFGGNLFLLERVGSEAGVVNVTVDAGCQITKSIPIQVGCAIPNVTGLWTVSGTETWSGCQEPEENGTYTGTEIVEIDSQVETRDGSQVKSLFTGSVKTVDTYADYIETYTELYRGEIIPDCDITDRCVFKVTGSTTYTEKYYFPENGETYIVRGKDTFEGTLKEGVIRLSTTGGDTSGDTCRTEGQVVLRR